jgi:molecular chaperone GrpE
MENAMRQAPSSTNSNENAAADLDALEAEGSSADRQRTSEEPRGDFAPGPEDALKKAERAAQEHHEAWLRAKAEADNIRKRAQTEIANAHKFALENFASELLAVRDSLEAALASEHATVEGMKAGVELTLKQLATVFDRFHIAEVNPLGQKFDPHRHQAISMQESGAESNTVIQVLQKGYLLHERVIRPALVVVAKARG